MQTLCRDCNIYFDVFQEHQCQKRLQRLKKQSQDKSAHIFIRLPTGKTIALDVQLSDSVQNLKKLIENKEAIPAHQQKLLNNKVEMPNQKCLSDCGVYRHETILHLILENQYKIDQKKKFCHSCQQNKKTNQNLLKQIQVQKLQIENLHKQILILQKKSAYQNEGLCKVCYDKEANYCNRNCGHLCVCEEHSKLVKCPLCGKEGEFFRIFFSRIGK